MERKLAASTSLHALDITSYSSPIHSFDSPLSALSKSLSSKFLFGRRSRSTFKLSGSTNASNVATPLSKVFTLPPHGGSTSRHTDSLSNLAAATPNHSEWENVVQPSPIAPSVLPTTDSIFSIPPSLIKYSNTFRTSHVSLVTSTFRKFRTRRAEATHVNMFADDASNANEKDAVAIPSLPALQPLSPLPHPAHPTTLPVTQSMSTMSHFAAPGHALRSTYSDSTMHLHSERKPVALFTRHQGNSSLSHTGGAVVYPRSAKSPSPMKRPTQLTQKYDGEGGLGIVGLLYCAKQGKYSLDGGMVVGNKSTSEEFVATVEPDTDGMGYGASEEDEDEGVMIDAGIVILRESRVKPTPSSKKMVSRVPPPQFEELAVPKDTPQSPLTMGPHRIIASHPMVREKHTGSATETAISSGSGTEAGVSGRSASGSEHSHTGVDRVDYGNAAGILAIFFVEGEEGNAFNHARLGTPGSYLNLPASAAGPVSPSNNMDSAFLQSPLHPGLGNPVSPSEHSQVSHPFWSGKRSQSMMGLFERSTPGTCSPSASNTGSEPGRKKSATRLGVLGRRGRKE